MPEYPYIVSQDATSLEIQISASTTLYLTREEAYRLYVTLNAALPQLAVKL